jgi:hypothetical protein
MGSNGWKTMSFRKDFGRKRLEPVLRYHHSVSCRDWENPSNPVFIFSLWEKV